MTAHLADISPTGWQHERIIIRQGIRKDGYAIRAGGSTWSLHGERYSGARVERWQNRPLVEQEESIESSVDSSVFDSLNA